MNLKLRKLRRTMAFSLHPYGLLIIALVLIIYYLIYYLLRYKRKNPDQQPESSITDSIIYINNSNHITKKTYKLTTNTNTPYISSEEVTPELQSINGINPSEAPAKSLIDSSLNSELNTKLDQRESLEISDVFKDFRTEVEASKNLIEDLVSDFYLRKIQAIAMDEMQDTTKDGNDNDFEFEDEQIVSEYAGEEEVPVYDIVENPAEVTVKSEDVPDEPFGVTFNTSKKINF